MVERLKKGDNVWVNLGPEDLWSLALVRSVNLQAKEITASLYTPSSQSSSTAMLIAKDIPPISIENRDSEIGDDTSLGITPKVNGKDEPLFDRYFELSTEEMTFKDADVLGFDPGHLRDWQNALDMGDLNEAALMHLLNQRFMKKKAIYTFLGDVLVSINPYSEVGSFDVTIPSQEEIDSMEERGELEPHLYLIADRALRNMFAEGAKGASQSILINGESGSGKTEAAKYIMRSLAQRSLGRKQKRKIESSDEMNKYLGKMGVSSGNANVNASSTRRTLVGNPAFAGRGRGRGLAAFHAATNRSEVGIGGRISEGMDDAGARVEKCFLQSNPLLEAFGNAKTIRNYNSSRFGKFVQVEYDQEGCILGAKTKHFFLEKTRLVSHRKGERNFHIFYQFYAAATAGMIPELENIINLQAISNYDFLCPISMTKDLASVSQVIREDVDDDDFTIEGVDDLQMFNETMNAMDTVGINERDKMHIWRVLSVILLLGNIKFFDPNAKDVVKEEAEINSNSNSDASSSSSSSPNISYMNSSSSRNTSASAIVKDDEQQVFNKAADLLGINKRLLESALCFRTLRAGSRGSFTMVPLSVTQAEESRDGLAKSIYDALFDWLVHKVNISTVDMLESDSTSSSSSNSKKKHPLFIGILDIFGFEVLPINLFEQLCINYANEVMQRMFDHHVFDLEQELYEKEGIDWSHINFRDNQVILDLIVKKPTGIFIVLDEQCLLGNQATDSAYLARINSVHGGGKNEHYNDRPKLQSINEFEIKHFAGPVSYNVSHIITKNMDALQTDLASLLSTKPSRRSTIQSVDSKSTSEKADGDMWAVKDDEEGEIDAGAQFIRDIFTRAWKDDSSSKKNAPKVSARAIKSSESEEASSEPSRKLATLETVSSRFRNQLNELNEQLLATSQAFVRCVKPNDEKLPLTWVSPLVLLQLQYLSVMEMVRIRREGFPVRQNPGDIVARFPELLKPTKFAWIPGVNDKKACEALLRSALGADSEKKLWHMGTTKVFLRDKVLETLSNLARKRYVDGAIGMQKIYRGWKPRLRYQEIKRAAKIINEAWRRYMSKKRYAEQLNNVTKIQALVRMYQQRERYRRMKAAAITIQKFLRSIRAKAILDFLRKQKQIEKLQAFMRMVKARKAFLRSRQIIIILQAYCRRKIIRPRYIQLKKVRDPWKSILLPNEAIVLSSLVEKSSVVHASSVTSRISTGFVSRKKRQLILTTGPSPRVMYVDVGSLNVKGQIPWDANEMGAIAITESDFVVYSKKPTDKDKRHWQFRDLTGPAICWVLSIRKSITVFDLVAHRQPSINETFQPSIISGPLLMKDLDTGSKREWAERYFQLQGNNLLWWDSQKDNFPAGGMNFLQECRVVPPEHSRSASKAGLSEAGFHIFTPFREKPLKFRVRSRKDEELWVHAFLRVIKISNEQSEIEFDRLEKAERLKELANRLFKVKDFVGARMKYQEALAICGFNFTTMIRGPDSINVPDSLLIACLNNRAACYMNLSNTDAAVDDLDAVLRIDPMNLIALKKRARVYETAGQLQLALDDIESLLMDVPEDQDVIEMNARVLSKIEMKKIEAATPKSISQQQHQYQQEEAGDGEQYDFSLEITTGGVLPTLHEEDEQDLMSQRLSNKSENKSKNGNKRQHGSTSSYAPPAKVTTIDNYVAEEAEEQQDEIEIGTSIAKAIQDDEEGQEQEQEEEMSVFESARFSTISSIYHEAGDMDRTLDVGQQILSMESVRRGTNASVTRSTIYQSPTRATGLGKMQTFATRNTMNENAAPNTMTTTSTSIGINLQQQQQHNQPSDLKPIIIQTQSIDDQSLLKANTLATPTSRLNSTSTSGFGSEPSTKKKRVGNTVIDVVIASHSYAPDAENKDIDLEFKKGTIIEVLHKYNDGWWKGILDGRIGMFPSTYVKPYQLASTVSPPAAPTSNSKKGITF